MRGLFVLVPALIAVCVIVGVVAATGRTSSPGPTPLHQTAVFFDGVNHADLRQTCSVWQAGRHHMAECEAYLEMLAATGGYTGYRVIPHSEKMWKEGRTSVASVKVRGPYGTTLTVRLVKTRKHGWLVVAAK